MLGADSVERVPDAIMAMGSHTPQDPAGGCDASAQQHVFEFTTNGLGELYRIPNGATHLFIGVDSADYESNVAGTPAPGIRYIFNP